MTLQYTILSIFFGLIIGFGLALCKISDYWFLKYASNVYTALFRGTPVLLQLGVIYYGAPQLIGYPISAFEAGVLTFSLNSGAYTSEIMKSGINSVDPGQWEGAKTLGLSYTKTLWLIIMPQALRIALPALVNEFADLIKESALIATLSEMDLLRRAQMVSAEKYVFFEPYFVAAFGYFILFTFFSGCARILGKRFSNG